jgi:hypothetical protein
LAGEELLAVVNQPEAPAAEALRVAGLLADR